MQLNDYMRCIQVVYKQLPESEEPILQPCVNVCCFLMLIFCFSADKCKFMDSKMKPLWLMYKDKFETVGIIFKNGDGMDLEPCCLIFCLHSKLRFCFCKLVIEKHFDPFLCFFRSEAGYADPSDDSADGCSMENGRS